MALIILSLLLLLGLYFSSFVLAEFNIAQSYVKSSQAYYLAEAGINEAIWKIKNDDTTSDGDPAWKIEFVTQPNCEIITYIKILLILFLFKTQNVREEN